MRVLLLEDDAEVREFIATCLKSWGHEVVMVDNGMTAWEEAANGSRFDLLIADWGVPGFSGVELVDMLRRIEQGRRLPILMISGRAQREHIAEALRAGIDGYLLKPFSPSALRQKLKGLAETREITSLSTQVTTMLADQDRASSREAGPLVVLGEQAFVPEELLKPERRPLTNYLLQAAQALREANATHPTLGVAYRLENSTFGMAMQLRRPAFRRRVRLVCIGSDCPGLSVPGLRTLASLEWEATRLILVCTDQRSADLFRHKLEGVPIELRYRQELDLDGWRGLLAETVLAAAPAPTKGKIARSPLSETLVWQFKQMLGKS